MTDFETLLVEQEGPILWVRLNRPEVLNAYTKPDGRRTGPGDPAR